MYPDPRIVQVDGRSVAVEDPGPSSGFPLLVHSGAGSRHLFRPAVRDAKSAGLRLIGYDRPGLGASTPDAGRSVADCAADVAAIMSDLGIAKIAVWGSSGGGPYALATAALLPEAVVAVCLFAPLGPYGMEDLDFADGMYMAETIREEIRVLFEEPKRARAAFRAQSAEMFAHQSSPEWWMKRWGERAGKDAAHSRDWAEYLAVCSRDGLGEDDEGWWDDWNASFHPWKFDVADVRAPVRIWHGSKDTAVPPSHSRWLASKLENATAHFPADEDHTNIEENHRAASFAWLRAQIASASE